MKPMNEGFSKKANRAIRAQQAMLGPKALMKGGPSGPKEKGKALAYKLKSNIEVAIDVKKVLEEHILNGKVEFTLGEVLGIAKCDFHEVIINIIKRKRQSLGDAATSNTQSVKIEEDEDVSGSVAMVGLIGELEDDEYIPGMIEESCLDDTMEDLNALLNLDFEGEDKLVQVDSK
jgi:hypothetical protein